jgi:hypothetical protein
MTAQLQHVITEARALSAREKLELLQAISQDLQQTYQLTEASAQFWNPLPLAELTVLQGIPVITHIDDLAADFWPEDETADDINDYVAARRRADRLGAV